MRYKYISGSHCFLFKLVIQLYRKIKPAISPTSFRQFLGDSPDTSKALRMLMKQTAVKRSGAGGRSDPYIYMMCVGRESCKVTASNSYFQADPCPNVLKRLSIEAVCSSNTVIKPETTE
ncbi:hypothetical protein POM88_043301 [Heracleum sosnowskyi]|uniref:SUEL-type lectin domain-containing protein n=1 Tax=Heracleum sosnowskyi TaxID=360622 RepID=A0AAD8H3B3_9APIA|nr:hypothetical protein POM88_043301 [Heracleum sosnowskyi]